MIGIFTNFYRTFFACRHVRIISNILATGDIVRIVDQKGVILVNQDVSAVRVLGPFEIMSDGIEILLDVDERFIGHQCKIQKLCPECRQIVHEFKFY